MAQCLPTHRSGSLLCRSPIPGAQLPASQGARSERHPTERRARALPRHDDPSAFAVASRYEWAFWRKRARSGFVDALSAATLFRLPVLTLLLLLLLLLLREAFEVFDPLGRLRILLHLPLLLLLLPLLFLRHGRSFAMAQ